jgi:hypothetical protein
MPVLRAQVRIPHASGTPRDTVTNTWHFLAATGAGDDQADVLSSLADFYNADNALGRSVGSFLADGIDRTGVRVRLYTVQPDGSSGDPLSDTAMPITDAGGSNSAPSELAVCLSFMADDSSGAPIRNRRGRIYLGPVSTETFEEISNVVRVYDTARTAIKDAAVRLIGLGDVLGVQWSVYSQKWKDTHPLDSSAFPVSSGFVDNEFDVQRSRGIRTSARTTFAA